LRVPESGLANHLVRLEEEAWGDGQAERLGGLEVDDQFVFHGPLHGQVSGLRPFQDFVDIRHRVPHDLDPIHPIDHEAPPFHGRPLLEDGW